MDISDSRPVLAPIGKWRAKSRNLVPQELVVSENPTFYRYGRVQVVVGVAWDTSYSMMPVRDLETYYEHVGEEG